MTQKSTKRELLMSALSLLLCVSMLVGTTYAWFTDSVMSGSNVIKSGSLDIVLEYWDGNGWVDADGKIIPFVAADGRSEILWEPGCTYEMAPFRVRNEGNLSARLLVLLNGVEGDEKLMEAVELKTKINNIPQSVLNGSAGNQLQRFEDAEVGILYGMPEGNVVFDWSLAGKGETTPGTGHTDTSPEFTISGHMAEEAGNEYQDLMLLGISITVLARQETYESDSFNKYYDGKATYPDVEIPPVDITDYATLKAAIANGKTNLKLVNDVEVSETLNVSTDIVLNGGKTLRRAEGFTGTVINVKSGVTLTLEDVTVDGGAVWSDPASVDGNSGVVATGNLIGAEANAKIILNKGSVLQNNDGAHAVNLGTRIGATLTMNGGEILYNRSDSGAVWGGGHITINSGKINNNRSTGAAGAIRMVGKCNLTMNGGEICNNVAATDGGAIWGYGTNGNSSVYDLCGGKISNNRAGGTGGGIYTGTYSTVNLSGNFEICNNVAADSGALRITNYTVLNMTGGKISGNVSTGNDQHNGFYAWCPRLTVTGGELADNVYLAGGHTPTVGGDGISGILYLNIGTAHNTINLAEDFGTFKFFAVEGGNFSAFNFKPAAGYTYADGDEGKLVCMNAGYETYWDAATQTFRLQAK